MIMYRTRARKVNEEIYLCDTAFLTEAREAAEKFYPGGYDIIRLEIDVEAGNKIISEKIL